VAAAVLGRDSRTAPAEGGRLVRQAECVETGGRRGERGRVRWRPGFHEGEVDRVDLSAYDRYLGRWSRLFVPALIAAAEIEPGDVVLDVATGTGEAAAAVVAVAGSDALVVGADISIGMLETARERLRGDARVVAADGGAMALRGESVDAVVCQLGLMFMPDPLGALVEFNRVVRPGGRVAVTVLGTAERVPIWGALAAALADRLPDQQAELYRSFALADRAMLQDLFTVAGFHDVSVSEERRIAVFETFEDYWQPIEAGVGMLPHAYAALAEPDRRRVRAEVARRLRQYHSGDGLELGIVVILAVGRR
jgi:SAM-dependent methyltransferase